MACTFLIVRTIHQHEIFNSQRPTGQLCCFPLIFITVCFNVFWRTIMDYSFNPLTINSHFICNCRPPKFLCCHLICLNDLECSPNLGCVLWGDLDQDQWSKIYLSGSWCIEETDKSITRMDSPVPLMHYDPDRSWITDPDSDHPKGMHPLFINSGNFEELKKQYSWALLLPMQELFR